MTTTISESKIFDGVPYCQCSQRISGEAALRDRIMFAYDPTLDWERVCLVGPVYGTDKRMSCCVPVDAVVGDRIVSYGSGDSGDRAMIYELVAVDSVVGEERAPWYPPSPTRRAIVKRVATGRARMDREPAEW